MRLREEGEMKAVISAVFTCSSRGCLAEMSLRLATDPPCQSAGRCVYRAASPNARGERRAGRRAAI